MSDSSMSTEDFHKLLKEILYPKLAYRSVEKIILYLKMLMPKFVPNVVVNVANVAVATSAPDDFQEISFDFLKRELEKGYISLDYVDGEMVYQDFGIYILRIRNQGAPIVDLGYRRSSCILLTEKGCKLDYEHRPSGGKLLIPASESYSVSNKKHRACHSAYDIDKCCYEWRPHQELLRSLAEYFKGKDIPCSL